MGKENSIKNKNINLKSYTDINYNKLPSSSSFSKDVNNFENTYKDMPNNFEEVNDYSFLNVVTEEITTLEPIYNSSYLKEILFNSLTDIDNNELYKPISVKEINNVISNLNVKDCKAFLHNVDNILYVEIIDQNNDNSYRVHLNHDGYSKLDNNSLDDILTYLIENNNHKG